MRYGRWDIPAGGLWDTPSCRGVKTGRSAGRIEGVLDESVELMLLQVEIAPLDVSLVRLLPWGRLNGLPRRVRAEFSVEVVPEALFPLGALHLLPRPRTRQHKLRRVPRMKLGTVSGRAGNAFAAAVQKIPAAKRPHQARPQVRHVIPCLT